MLDAFKRRAIRMLRTTASCASSAARAVAAAKPSASYAGCRDATWKRSPAISRSTADPAGRSRTVIQGDQREKIAEPWRRRLHGQARGRRPDLIRRSRTRFASSESWPATCRPQPAGVRADDRRLRNPATPERRFSSEFTCPCVMRVRRTSSRATLAFASRSSSFSSLRMKHCRGACRCAARQRRRRRKAELDLVRAASSSSSGKSPRRRGRWRRWRPPR